ncbi:MAG: hypothetical protein DIU68_018220 [Chloroflexota bacterium]|nr:MAG: hypothetical protein DIU68_10195 [Chloroflexota bacterium]
MDELVKLVASKTGLSEDLARTAVNTVLDFLKQRLPEPLAGQIDSVIAGGGASTGGLGGILGGLGGSGRK